MRIFVSNGVAKFPRVIFIQWAAGASAVDADECPHSTQQERNDEEDERCAAPSGVFLSLLAIQHTYISFVNRRRGNSAASHSRRYAKRRKGRYRSSEYDSLSDRNDTPDAFFPRQSSKAVRKEGHLFCVWKMDGTALDSAPVARRTRDVASSSVARGREVPDFGCASGKGNERRHGTPSQFE